MLKNLQPDHEQLKGLVQPANNVSKEHTLKKVSIIESCCAYHYNPDSGIFSVHLSCTACTVSTLKLHITFLCPITLQTGKSCYLGVPVGEVMQKEWHVWKLRTALKHRQNTYANNSKPISEQLTYSEHSNKITEAKLGTVLFIIAQDRIQLKSLLVIVWRS